MVTKGSRSVKLHPMVVDVSLALRKYGIKVEAVWRSKKDGLIQWADKGSRDFHSDNILLEFVSMQGIQSCLYDDTSRTFCVLTNHKASFCVILLGLRRERH